MAMWSLRRKSSRSVQLRVDSPKEQSYDILSAGGEHVALLPKSVRSLARTILTAATISQAAMKAGKPPSSRLWGEIFDRMTVTLNEYDISASPFHPTDPTRKIVGRALRCIERAPLTHEEMDTRFTIMMYWCCLGHAGYCTVSRLYEKNVRLMDIVGSATGCGISPLPEIESYWKPLCRAVATKGNAAIGDDAELAHYMTNLRESPTGDGESYL
ncbi:virion protein US10 [Gallid alphaherpesvirus 2]|nr:virion protein US10 [Gallid alphaherpesvirus 2]